MSLIDSILDILISVIKSSILKLPHDISVLPISTIQTNITEHIQVFAQAYGFVDNLMPIGLILTLFGTVIIAEVLLHLGWKGFKFILNLFRGSGG